MGLTGFNRQRKRAISAELGVDEQLADKLMAYGYSTAEAVKKAEDLHFLSKDELKQVKGKLKAQLKEVVNEDQDEKPEEPEEKQDETPEESDVAASEDLDEEFLALPEGTEFPHKITAGWHYLSNGDKVNGKAAAMEAEAQLKEVVL